MLLPEMQRVTLYQMPTDRPACATATAHGTARQGQRTAVDPRRRGRHRSGLRAVRGACRPPSSRRAAMAAHASGARAGGRRHRRRRHGHGRRGSLLRAGFATHARDIRPEAQAAAAALGATCHPDAAALARACDIAIVLVVDAAQVDDVLFGPDGAARRVPATAASSCSSSTVGARLHAALAPRLAAPRRRARRRARSPAVRAAPPTAR